MQVHLHDSDEKTGPASRTDGPTRDGRRVGRLCRDEGGFVLVWASLFILVLLGFAALAVDLGHSYYVGERAQDAADAAALAGAPYLPGDVATAVATAKESAATNGFSTTDPSVSLDAHQDPANPAQLIVTIHQTVATWFGGAIGFKSMEVAKSATGIASESSSATPVDMVLILDRTGSMKSTDLQAVHDATNALLGSLDPKFDRLALAYTGQSLNATTCGAGALGAPAPKGTASGGYTWIVAPYPNVAPLTDYQDSTSPIAKSVACITTAQFNSSVGTDLGNPVAAAASYLNGLDDGAQKDIILMTDGAANVSPSGQQPCAFANSTATSAKNAGITVVTIGFGVGDKSVADDTCTDSSGAYVGAPATTLLANMATTSVDNGCTDAENSDGDNFFCEPKNSGDLSSVFVEAAASLTGDGTRLVK